MPNLKPVLSEVEVSEIENLKSAGAHDKRLPQSIFTLISFLKNISASLKRKENLTACDSAGIRTDR
jgi:hypothetical protein